MNPDEVMRELHEVKDSLASECNFDIRELFRRLEQKQISSGRKYVSFCGPAEPVTVSEGDSSYRFKE